MVAGNRVKRLGHIKFLVNQARDASRGYYHTEVGFNDRMTNIEAAMGLAQMEQLDGFLKKKKTFNRIYREEFKNVKDISFQEEYTDGRSSWWLTCVMFKKGTNTPLLQAALKKKGVSTRRIFTPVVEFPPYRGFRNGAYENSYKIYESALSLPSSTLNSESDVRYVCRAIKELV